MPMHPCLASGEVTSSLSVRSRSTMVAVLAAEDEDLFEATLIFL